MILKRKLTDISNLYYEFIQFRWEEKIKNQNSLIDDMDSKTIEYLNILIKENKYLNTSLTLLERFLIFLLDF